MIYYLKAMNTIEVLKGNIVLEHIAILQYLHHMFFVKDKKLRSAIEEIAKEEMLHMHIFASRAVNLGCHIKLESVENSIFFDPGYDLKEFIEANIKAEEEAIDIYTSQIEHVSDELSKRILEKVAEDEREHKSIFEDMLAEVDKHIGYGDKRASEEVINFINSFMKEKYEEILKYLELLFNTRNNFKKDIAFQNAIDSMKMMGHLGEEIGEKGLYVYIKYGLKNDANMPKSEITNYFSNIFTEMNNKKEKYSEFFLSELDREHGFTIGDLTSEV